MALLVVLTIFFAQNDYCCTLEFFLRIKELRQLSTDVNRFFNYF